MKRTPTSWTQMSMALAMFSIPGLVAVCFFTGRCGAEPPVARTSDVVTVAPSLPASRDTVESKGTIEMQTTAPTKKTYGRVVHVKSDEFQREVLNSEAPVLVDFYADWCGPCRMLSPVLDELAKEVPNAKIVKVNVDDSPEVAGKYGVNSIPMLIAFEDGKAKSQVVGLAPKSTLKKMLDE